MFISVQNDLLLSRVVSNEKHKTLVYFKLVFHAGAIFKPINNDNSNLLKTVRYNIIR